MGAIRVLPDAVINQIAAGEVVERPASVVKELLENAVDAGAGQVTVTLQEGGKQLISVLDDGRGMDEADVRLACQRHATSKLAEAEGLVRLQSLGFRGEALASIAAVSRFELISCADEHVGGTRIAIEGGRELGFGRVGFARGTKVTVEALFHNTPARRKFLRATTTEFGHCQGAFVNVALAQPGLRLRLVHNGRTVYSLAPCGRLAERVAQLFGDELGEGMLPVAGRAGTVGWEGLISLPSASRASRRWQYLFLNGRPIRHAGLNHGVYQAYRTLLMKGRHPAYVLQLAVDPAEVDVNVHPAKTEVRLRNAQALHTVLADRLYRALLEGSRRAAFGEAPPRAAARRALRSGDPQLALGLAARATAPEPGETVADAAPHLSASPETAAPPAVPSPAGADAGGAASSPVEPTQPVPEGGGLRVNPLDGQGFGFQPLTGEVGGAGGPGAAGLGEAPQAAGETPEGGRETGVVLAQLAATYLLVQRGRALMIVDQHAAHERILFERLRTQFYAGRMATERFLVPETLELSPQNALLLEQYLPQWRRMGFDIEPFGRHSYVVREVPALLAGKAVGGLLLEVLDELALFGKSGRLEEVFNEIMERIACHSAVRAGDRLSREEMEALMEQLEGVDVSLHCPHGRPVWVELSPHELERRFKRIV